MIRKEFPWVRLEVCDANVGYTRANNRGIALATGRYILFLNPDTAIVGPALTTMVQYMDAHPAVGALGPQLLEADGRVQSSRRRFPSRLTALVESTVWQPLFANSPLLRHYYCLDRPDDQVQAVDWVTGAALLVRRSVLEQVGGFDEGFFMYSEELDLCRRIKAAGWDIHYLPMAQVIHHGGKSSEQAIASRHIHFQSSKIRYFTKYHGRGFGECLRLYLLATYVYQLSEEGAKWLLGHKRPLRAQRLAVYWQVLRSGLRRTEETGLQNKTAWEIRQSHLLNPDQNP